MSSQIVTMDANVVAQQVMSFAVQAMTLSIFAQALGVMSASASLKIPLTEQAPSESAKKELASVYGAALVAKVLNENPGADIAALAGAIDGEATAQMRLKYGDKIADIAISTADPLDYKGALRIAESIKNKGQLPAEVAVPSATGKQKSARGGRKPGQPQLDTKTGIEYPTKSAAARGVLAEFRAKYEGKIDPKNNKPLIQFFNADGTPNTFVWYGMIKVEPGRFKEV